MQDCLFLMRALACFLMNSQPVRSGPILEVNKISFDKAIAFVATKNAQWIQAGIELVAQPPTVPTVLF